MLLIPLASLALCGLSQDGEVPAKNEVPVPVAISRGCDRLLEMQKEGEDREWPYEGVYKVGGEIPIGYRVGGSAIAASTLMQSPGYADDPARQEAVARALDFIVESIEHPLMDPDYTGGYDVRGWGQAYALWFLCRLERLGLTPRADKKRAKKAIKWYLDALEEIEIPENGGWSYSRAPSLGQPSRPSPFMTAPCLQALFEAAEAGYRVDGRVVERGLDALENGIVESGAVTYAVGRESETDRVPGAVGRMLATQSTLVLAGRSTPADARAALDAFLVHWRWLDKRRAQDGTHVKPYAVAPYYFYYAHYFAALAIELLPEGEREEYRLRLRELLFRNRLEDDTWNDRIFETSKNYGTSMAVLALMMPELTPPAAWESKGAKKKR